MQEIGLIESVAVEEWQRILQAASEDQYKRFVRRELSSVQNLDFGNQVRTLVFDWLCHLKFLTDLEVLDVYHFVAPRLQVMIDYMSDFAAGRMVPPAEGIPTFQIILSDYQFVSCSGFDSFYDLKTDDDTLTSIDWQHNVTHLICNVTALYYRAVYRLQLLRRQHTPVKDDKHDDDEASRRTAGKTLSDFADGPDQPQGGG